MAITKDETKLKLKAWLYSKSDCPLCMGKGQLTHKEMLEKGVYWEK